jgi:hypothetical protein
VLVTFLEPQSLDLRAGGIEIPAVAKAAAPLKEERRSPRTGTVSKWPCTMTTMPLKPVYKRGAVLLKLFPYSDFRTAKLRPALDVAAAGFHTGLHQVTVGMTTGLLFRANHPSWMVEVVTREVLVMFADTSALTSVKVTFPFFLVRTDGRKYSSKCIHRDDHPELLLRSAHRTGNDRSEKLDTGMMG